MKENQRTNLYQNNLVTVRQLNEEMIEITHNKLPSMKSGFPKNSGKKVNKSNDHKLINNLSRTRGTIFDIAIANDFDYFITLTTSSKKVDDRHDLNDFIKRLGQIILNMRKRKIADIQYLLVPEKHKDGAWHMHGLIKNIPNEELEINKNGYLEWSRYQKNFGNMTMSKVKNQESVSRYIIKYINKDIANGLDKNKKAYYSTRGLERPKIIKKAVMTKILQSQLPKSRFENKYFAEYILSNEQYALISTLFTDILA